MGLYKEGGGMPREVITEYYTKVTDESKYDNRYLSSFVYGKAGTGKTQFIGTFPKPFVIDTDLGMLTLAGKDIKSFSITTDMMMYDTILNIIQDIKHQKGPWEKGGPLSDRKTIAIDSMSITGATMFTQILEVQKKDTRSAYGTLLSQLTTLTSLFRELKLYGYHVIATAGEVTKENNQTGISEPVPLLPGSFRDFIAHQFDQAMWFEVQVRQGKPTYNSFSLAEKGHQAKERIGLPGKVENLTFDLMVEYLDKKFKK